MTTIQWQPRHQNFSVRSTSNPGRNASMSRANFETALPECVSLAADAIAAPSQVFIIPYTTPHPRVGR